MRAPPHRRRHRCRGSGRTPAQAVRRATAGAASGWRRLPASPQRWTGWSAPAACGAKRADHTAADPAQSHMAMQLHFRSAVCFRSVFLQCTRFTAASKEKESVSAGGVRSEASNAKEGTLVSARTES